MRKTLWPWWTVLLWMAVWVTGALAVSVAGASCVKKPDAQEQGDDGVSGIGEGHRVVSMRWDPVLRRQWAQVADCAHPEWPDVEVPMHEPGEVPAVVRPKRPSTVAAPPVPVVRAGDAVQLWSEQSDLRLVVAAIAEQSGAPGQVVRVRLMPRKTLGQQVEREFTGVVRGPHEVEMQR